MIRPLALAAVLTAVSTAASAAPAELSSDAAYAAAKQLLSQNEKSRKAGARKLRKAGDRAMVPALVDAIFFTRKESRQPLFTLLESLTGERFEGYYEWVEYVGAHEELVPKPGYDEWKGSLFSRIDRGYEEILYRGVERRLRLEEVVSGGVAIEGIPAIDSPAVIAGSEAAYLDPAEQVFGVSIDGEARAYPLRILDWHEMLNDELGGRPLTLSYCTLCGSGILYDASMPGGGRFWFGTSGLLYRSNKLMLERESRSLWSNLTGQPVVGSQVGSGLELPVLPMTRTSWSEWLERHPSTTVLDLGPLRGTFSRRYGFDYRPGQANRAREGVAFPVWLKSSRLERGAEVYTLLVAGTPKAYPLDRLYAEGVVNDSLGGVELVLVADGESGAVRAFERRGRAFAAGADGALVDQTGGSWRVLEEGLAADGQPTLPRVAGHVAYWFGWYAFYPQTEIWGGEGPTSSE